MAIFTASAKTLLLEIWYWGGRSSRTDSPMALIDSYAHLDEYRFSPFGMGLRISLISVLAYVRVAESYDPMLSSVARFGRSANVLVEAAQTQRRGISIWRAVISSFKQETRQALINQPGLEQVRLTDRITHDLERHSVSLFALLRVLLFRDN